MSIYTGSNLEAILAELAAAMGVPNKIGSEEEARHGAPPRIVWVPKADSFGDPIAQPEDGHAVAQADELYLVHIWGEDFGRAQALRNLLIGGLADEFSPVYGYKLGDADWTGGGLGKRGFLLVLPVTLRVPIYDAQWRRHRVRTVGVVPGADGVGGGRVISNDQDPGEVIP